MRTSWPANSIEPGQIARNCWWKWLFTFGFWFSRVRVKIFKKNMKNSLQIRKNKHIFKCMKIEMVEDTVVKFISMSLWNHLFICLTNLCMCCYFWTNIFIYLDEHKNLKSELFQWYVSDYEQLTSRQLIHL